MIGLLKVNRKLRIGWLTHSNLAPSSAAFQLVSIRFNLTWISLRSRQGKALGISPCVSTRLLVQNQNMKFGFYYVDGSRHIHGLHKFSIPYFSVSGNSQFILRRAMEFWFIRLLNGRVGGQSLTCKSLTFPLRRGSICFGCSVSIHEDKVYRGLVSHWHMVSWWLFVQPRHLLADFQISH